MCRRIKVVDNNERNSRGRQSNVEIIDKEDYNLVRGIVDMLIKDC